jgi:predicted PurR-regulated permease PerM
MRRGRRGQERGGMDILNSPRAARDTAPDPEAIEAERRLRQLTSYAIIGLFALAVLAALQLAGEIVVPLFSALIVGVLLGQVIDRLVRLGLPPSIAGISVVGVAIALGILMIEALIDPFSSFVAQAPKMTEAALQAASRILAPIAKMRAAILHTAGANDGAISIGNETAWLSAVLGRLTPAVGEILVFFACMAFLVAGRAALRKQLILAMPERDSRLKMIRAFGAVETAVVQYFGATALVYAGVAAAVGVIAFAFGLSNPLLWSTMTFVAAYIPYLGVALIALSLAATGLLAHPDAIAYALAPTLAYLAIHTVTEIAIIPTMLGRRHEINPFLIFLSIVFWSWMWGPVGAILATPMLVTMQSLIGVMLAEEARLP